MLLYIRRIRWLKDIDVEVTTKFWRTSDAATDNSDPEDYDADALAKYVSDPANIMLTAFVDEEPVGFVL